MSLKTEDTKEIEIICNSQGNVYYFPLWRILLKAPLVTWTMESRYLEVLHNSTGWTHNCIKMGSIYIYENEGLNCPHCGANYLNEPLNDDIILMIEHKYPPIDDKE